MKKLLYLFLTIIIVATSLTSFLGCTKSTDLGVVALTYYDETDETIGYNKSLFYRNDLLTYSADPGAIKVTEGDYAGWFFVYGTKSGVNFVAMKSRDLSNWEEVGVCYEPDDDSWGRSSMWAPGIIYDNGKYYLFYSATNTSEDMGKYGTKSIGLAISDSPAGPFIQYTGTNSNSEVINIDDPIFDGRKAKDAPFFQTEYAKQNNCYQDAASFIDACPFIASDGTKYLYMSRTRNANATNVISVVKMIDWATPDYSTYTEITQCNKTTVSLDAEDTELAEGKINECPFMIEHNGKFYLTLSINATTDPEYSVIQAVGDSPLGPFTKIQASKGGLVLGVDVDWDHVLCTGGQSFVQDGDELWIVYHQDRNRASEGYSGVGNNERSYACDKVNWVTNEDGLEVLNANGPSTSIQPLPKSASNYYNIATQATVTAKQTSGGATTEIDSSATKLLNDDLVRYNSLEIFDEFYAEGTVQVTMSFDDYKTARALLIYNSCMYDSAFYLVARIDFSFRKEYEGQYYTGTARVENLYYDLENYSQLELGVMRPGAPLTIEFDELEVNSVTITFVCPTGQENIGVSEIMILGK